MKSTTKNPAKQSNFESRLSEIVDEFVNETLTSRPGGPGALASRLVKGGVLPAKAAPAAGIDVRVLPIEIGGKGCKRGARLIGIFLNTLVPRIGCLGAPVVLGILNQEASNYCLNKLCPANLKCPKRCPCAYDLAAALALYRCAKTVEIGILLPPPSTWNCHCKYIG